MFIKHNIKSVLTVSASYLLCFIVVFNLLFNVIHTVSGSHQHLKTETCTKEAENDACHRFLVHHEKSHACNGGHKHVTEKSESCFVCKYSQAHNLFFETYPGNFHLQKGQAEIPAIKKSFISPSGKDVIFLRGPPGIS